MRGYFNTSQISEEEKNDILSKHREIYNGYQTMNSNIPNQQPLYVQDFAKDKVGAVMGNNGNIKGYTNMGINESFEQDFEDEMSMEDTDEMAFDNSEVTEGGECMECGSGYMEEENLPDSNLFEGAECSECGGIMSEGECMECGWKGDMEEQECLDCEDDNLNENVGKLSDIYNVEDLDPFASVDYAEGSDNYDGSFEQMHKNLYKEDELDELGTHELSKGKKYKFTLPSFEDEIEYDDESEDKQGGEKMYKFKGKEAGHLMPSKSIEDFVSNLDEQGGNADDMDVDDVEPAYDFVSDGPMDGGDVYPVNEIDVVDDEEMTFEPMESAWADDVNEVDISGVQGMYSEMDPAYDFDSEGPGSAGPYQRRFSPSVGDSEEGELEVNFDEFDPRDKSWEEITDYTGEDEFGAVDEDLKESFILQKNKITEMFDRMKRF